jgi:hypothetical protein
LVLPNHSIYKPFKKIFSILVTLDASGEVFGKVKFGRVMLECPPFGVDLKFLVPKIPLRGKRQPTFHGSPKGEHSKFSIQAVFQSSLGKRGAGFVNGDKALTT